MGKTCYTLNNNNYNNSKFGEVANGLYEEKKSKFYSYIFNISNESEAINYINTIKENNKDARHVVYIYSIKNGNSVNIRFSDDGEPQGTGTRAIYDTLEKEYLTNLCIVIVRYFGGILLGAGPLSRAYLKAYKEAEQICDTEPIYNYINFDFETSYSNFNNISNILNNYIKSSQITVLNKEFNDIISMSLSIREDIYKEFLEKINTYI